MSQSCKITAEIESVTSLYEMSSATAEVSVCRDVDAYNYNCYAIVYRQSNQLSLLLCVRVHAFQLFYIQLF